MAVVGGLLFVSRQQQASSIIPGGGRVNVSRSRERERSRVVMLAIEKEEEDRRVFLRENVLGTAVEWWELWRGSQ